ncbi:hypothetical protein SSX86_024598 [Deinandra increscens subsp. villosa]|uniref:Uncharacterized protein n=1 Tax=Deinandra increscens subsp. villosa TaxID=3103831 RepID=A0AAP0CAY3_9ASTR
MAPNPRVAKAFRAMRELGIPEEKTKPVLKNLLKLYEKNWELIEDDNYRALADAIFDSEEAEVCYLRMKAIEEETQIPEEPERPLKRLRLRHQDGSSCPTISPNSHGTPMKKPKLEIDDLPFAIPRSQSRAENATGDPISVSSQTQGRNKGKQPVLADTQPDVTNVSGSDLGLRLRHRRDKGKEPISHQTSSQELRSISDRTSHGVRFKEPKPKQTALPLIKPKDEPLTDDTSPLQTPVSETRPESMENADSSTENLSRESNKDSISNVLVSSNEISGHELAAVLDESTAKIDIASSSYGEITISLTCNSTQNPNLSVTNVDTLLKRMEDRCLKSYKALDPNFSVKKLMTYMCDSLLEPEPEPEPDTTEGLVKEAVDTGNNSLPFTANGSVGNEVEEDACENGSVGNEVEEDACENGFQETDPQTANGTMSLHDINDIAKGQESVIISLVNEVNTECPPAFHYIPGNAVFQNAYVNFSLARIGDDNCCSTCFGDCLTSATACACALQSGGEFAYTKEGLVKEELIDECIKMMRDPQKHCLFYCKECPLERSKNEEIVEACKGHSVRSFIKECWLKCGCNKQCGNRVVQRGIQRKLQVFMTPGGKGWGLRTLEDLPKGAFVCEYVGEVLTNAELFERVSKANKDEHTYPVLLDADWGAECELKDEEALCLDATYYGNVARFINHRCFDSTLVEIPVEVENPDHHYYHLAFFTTRKVKALEELTWDYGIDFDDEEHPVKAFRCRCGSRFCRNNKRPNSKYSTHTHTHGGFIPCEKSERKPINPQSVPPKAREKDDNLMMDKGEKSECKPINLQSVTPKAMEKDNDLMMDKGEKSECKPINLQSVTPKAMEKDNDLMMDKGEKSECKPINPQSVTPKAMEKDNDLMMDKGSGGFATLASGGAGGFVAVGIGRRGINVPAAGGGGLGDKRECQTSSSPSDDNPKEKVEERKEKKPGKKKIEPKKLDDDLKDKVEEAKEKELGKKNIEQKKLVDNPKEKVEERKEEKLGKKKIEPKKKLDDDLEKKVEETKEH